MRAHELGIRLHDARKRLARVRSVREWHAQECPHWDYEGSDCLDCQQHDIDLAKARSAVRALEACDA